MAVAGGVILGQISLDFHDDPAQPVAVIQPPHQQFTQQPLGYSGRVPVEMGVAVKEGTIEWLASWLMHDELILFSKANA
jgi:hypothetical protein